MIERRRRVMATLTLVDGLVEVEDDEPDPPGTMGVFARFFGPHGSMKVRQGSRVEIWSPREVALAVSEARKCCESRRVNFVQAALDNCPCLACQVAKVVRRREGRL